MSVSTVTQDLVADTLAFWHGSLDVEATDELLQWGPVAPGSSDERELRVRNLSDSYWAAAVVVAVTGPDYPGAPASVAEQHWLSTDGDRFTASVALGDLGPRAISPVLTLRRVTPPDAAPGDGGFMVVATAADWYAGGHGTLDNTGSPAGGDELAPELPPSDPHEYPVIDPVVP